MTLDAIANIVKENLSMDGHKHGLIYCRTEDTSSMLGYYKVLPVTANARTLTVNRTI